MLIALFNSNRIVAQSKDKEKSFSISGIVKDKKSEETLPFAQIEVLGTSNGTQCNVDGLFSLINLEGEQVTLRISYMGYTSQTVTVHKKDSKKVIPFLIVPSVEQLNEVVLTKTKPKEIIKIASGVSRVSINPKQLAVLPNLGEVDVFRAMQLLPGISGTSETSSGLVVRGGTPDQNLILFDGFTVYHVDHFFGVYSAFNANVLKDIQLYKSAFPAKFGGRVSSVVDITGLSGNTKKISGNFGINLLSVNGVLEVPINKKLTIIAGVRRSYTDVIRSGPYNKLFKSLNNEVENSSSVFSLGGGSESVQPKFHFYDLNTKLTYRPNNKNTISMSLYNGKDNLDKSTSVENSFGSFGGSNNSSSSKSINLTKWGNLGASFRWGRQWNKKLYSNLIIGASNYFSDYLNKTESTNTLDGKTETFIFSTIQKNNVEDLTLRLDNEWRLNQSNLISFGVSTTKNDIEYNVSFDSDTIEDQKQKGTYSSIYLQDELNLGTKSVLTIGARATQADITDKTYLSPRVSFTYKLTKDLKFKTSWGKYQQYVNRVIVDDILDGSRDFWLLADDDDISTIESEHFVAGFTWEKSGFLVDIEAYQKDMTGLMEYTRRFSGLDIDNKDQNFFKGNGKAKGLELLVQKKTGKYTGWFSYTLSSVKHKFPGINQGKEFSALHDQRHEFKVVNILKLGQWDLSSTWIYGTGKPYSAPIGKYDITTLDGTKKSYISIGEKNTFRLPAYHRLDFAAMYNFKWGKLPVQIGASIFNAYGRQNIKSRKFSYEYFDPTTYTSYDTPRLKTVDVKLLGFTPNLLFNIKF